MRYRSIQVYRRSRLASAEPIGGVIWIGVQREGTDWRDAVPRWAQQQRGQVKFGGWLDTAKLLPEEAHDVRKELGWP